MRKNKNRFRNTSRVLLAGVAGLVGFVVALWVIARGGYDEKLRRWVYGLLGIIFTSMAFIVALWVIARGGYDPGVQEWALGVIGVVLGCVGVNWAIRRKNPTLAP